MRSIHPQNFITLACLVLQICNGKKLSIKKTQRAITQKLRKQELWFLCIALRLDEIYPPTKFHNHSLLSLRDMHRKKCKYKKKPKGNNSKIKQARVTVHMHCTPLDKIYPPTKFHNHSKYSFQDMHRTKLKYESKQRAITKKISKQELWFICIVLPLDKIYPPTKFHNHS